ncbi:hypothetical protein SteCoe_20211 [Stentor coeruleus]|uniref:PIPK domain-containing protein n=1 Tax=Stentor coeruleus TaxID=5963 RepID=A0A1R2BSQ1_9CILI|nr:hypothetical protein SteCoe_20211 [Stentor coeruleus]
MEFQEENPIAFTFLSSVNIIFSCLLILTYFKSSKFRQHPSGIIVALAFCELASTYHLMVFMWDEEKVIKELALEKARYWRWLQISEDYAIEYLCAINTTIFCFGMIAGIFYNFFLCIDLILSLRNPFTSAYKRMPIYHALVFLFTITIGGYVSWKNSMAICLFNMGKNYTKLDLITSKTTSVLLCAYILVGMFSILYASIRVYTGIKLSNLAMKKYLTRHFMYVLINTIVWSLCVASFILKKLDKRNMILEEITTYLLSIAGLVIAMIRFSDPSLYSNSHAAGEDSDEEKNKFNDNDDEWNIPVSTILTELSTELGLNIYETLHMVYKGKSKNIQMNITENMKKNVKHFSESFKSRISDIIKNSDGNLTSETIEFAPELFDFIRYISNFNNAEFAESLDPLRNIDSLISANESKGKSGSFFMFSADRRIVIKTIKEKELKDLIRILYHYARHLESNPNSLLCRMYGAFYLKFAGITPMFVILMENLTHNSGTITRLYDLKGSTLGRGKKTLKERKTIQEEIKGNKSLTPFKDLDFIRHGFKVTLNSTQYSSTIQAINRDADFLMTQGLIDYSMLLLIEDSVDGKDPVVKFGIIDFLIRYGIFKRLERLFTILLNPTKYSGASVARPSIYAKRFKDFMTRSVFQISNNY